MNHNMKDNTDHRCFRRAWMIAAAVFGLTALHAFAANVPAFPGAEGYGAQTRGGRGGHVIAVNNLDA